MKSKSLYFEDVNVGDEVPSLEKAVTTVNMVMYQAATWDFHRYHYDTEYVQAQGFPKPFLDGQMMGGFLAQLLMDWMGIEGTLKKLGFRFTNFVYPGDTLTCKGRVSGKEEGDGQHLVECEMWIENQKGERVLDQGRGVVALPAGSASR